MFSAGWTDSRKKVAQNAACSPSRRVTAFAGGLYYSVGKKAIVKRRLRVRVAMPKEWNEVNTCAVARGDVCRVGLVVVVAIQLSASE